jgi:hypothetical protein
VVQVLQVFVPCRPTVNGRWLIVTNAYEAIPNNTSNTCDTGREMVPQHGAENDSNGDKIMGGWTIIQDGERYSLPFDFEFPRSRLKADLPDAVMVTNDTSIRCWAMMRRGLLPPAHDHPSQRIEPDRQQTA